MGVNAKYNKRLIFFLLTIFICTIVVFIYIGITGNEHQVFTDVVEEFTSRHGINKSAERKMFFIIPLLGIVLYGIMCLGFARNENEGEKEIDSERIWSIVIGLSLLVNYVVYKKCDIVFLAALVIIVLCFSLKKLNFGIMLSAYFIELYALCGLYRLYVFLGGKKATDINKIVLIALTTIIVISLIKNKELLIKGILILQLIIPFTLLIFLSNTYLYCDGTIERIAVPKRITVPIVVLITMFEVENLCLIKKIFNNSIEEMNYLSVGTIASIMSFNRYSGSGLVTNFDLHHTFENVIGFSEIFKYGQNPFEGYIPISGMYSVFHGFYLWLFGHGNAGYYYITSNLFF